MEEFLAALENGDYAGAYDTLGRLPEASTPMGAASGAFLLALMGHYDQAEQMLVGVGAPAIEVIVRGERARMARWRDPVAAGQLQASSPLPFVGMYAGMAVALVEQDAALVERIKGDMEKVAPVGGRLRFTDGTEREFASIVDSDDAIGPMLETYTGGGLLYFPFASLRRIDFAAPQNFIDLLVPKAQVVDVHGQDSLVFVPLLYAGSTMSPDPQVRAGRMTHWEYVGSARRGIGQRDFGLDAGVMVGMERVASIELAATAA